MLPQAIDDPGIKYVGRKCFRGITGIRKGVSLMKKIIFCALLLPVVLLAQDFGGMNQQDMQKMMEQARAARVCMEKIDQNELEKLKVRGEEISAEIAALCDGGDKAKARSVAVAYAKEIEAESVLQELKGCTGLIEQQIPMLAWSELEDPGSKYTDVCELDM